MRRPATVRGRTALAATGVVAVALALAGLAFVLVLQRSLTRNIDDNLTARADDAVALLAAGASPDAATHSRQDRLFVQLVAGNGEVLSSSTTIPDNQRLVTEEPPDQTSTIRTMSDLSVGEEGQDFRVAEREVRTPTGPATLYLADSLEPVEQSLGAVIPQLLVGLPILLAVVALTTYAMAGRALRPVTMIRRRVAAITSRDLAARVPEPDTHDEIAELARIMNSMLGRLETASIQQRRFIADASHELRSPLTTLRMKTEVALAHPERTNWARTTEQVLREIERLSGLVDDLLLLARASDAPGVRTATVELDDLVHTEAERLTERGVTAVQVGGVSPAQVRGDVSELSRLLRNLGDNAERHAESTVRLTLRTNETEAVLDVDDDGAGILPSQRERIFQRFTRLDDARTREAGGSGLGLALAREIALAHTGELEVLPNDLGGARFRLRLPLASTSALVPVSG